ncbi:reverse transcriptase domain-containing protein [Tanacetum coccineum]
MHNNIMAAGSKDRPPMLGPGRYSQWRSRFLRYIDTKGNGEYLRKCIFEGPYKLTMRTNTTSSSTRPSASTRHKGKEIAKPVTPQSESVSEEDSDPEQAQRDKDMQKNLALLAKYFKKLYKPTNNNLRTSSNSRNKTEDTTPRYNNDNQSGQFGNQRTMTVVGARETVGSQVVQQNGIQCFNCKGMGHYAKECRKPKRVKDYTYHKEKMMMCKQAEQGVPLQAEQADWLEDTDEEIDEQELEAHYSFMAKIQEVLPEESSSTDQPLEQLGIESYQMKVNITAPTITFPGIETLPLYSIIGDLFVGIIYENSKKERRATNIDELWKFDDATLKRVSRKIKAINMEAQHDFLKTPLSKQDKKQMVLFEEEIEEGLKYRRQMRRWKSFVNERPISNHIVHPE